VAQSLVRQLARHRSAAGPQPVVRYDAARQISMILEDGQWVPSYDSATVPQSKKADIETGEDQKSQ
jgi:hypothetical protein